MMEQVTEIYENVKGIVLPLIGSGIVACEITPIIKIKPVSMFLGWVGKKINKDLKDDIDNLKKDVRIIGKDLQDHTVESMRRDILTFSDRLRFNSSRSKEEYDYIINLYDRYEKYLEENSLDNGKVDLAYEFITKRYKECMENNSFYTGK